MGKAGYGRIYVEAGVTAQALNAGAGTFNKVTAFATDGISDHATPANASDNVTLEEAGGVGMPIHVQAHLSFTVGTAGLYRFAIYKDGVLIPGTERRLTCALATTYNVSLAAVTVTANDRDAPVFDVRAASDQVSPNLTVSYGSLEVF